MADYSITINGVDRTSCIYNQKVTISDDAGSAPSTLDMEFIERDGNGLPENEQEIIVLKDDVKLFAGYIVKTNYSKLGGDKVIVSLDCIDYTRDLSRKLVVENYQDMTDKAIIEDIVSRYCQGTGITTNNVIEGITINQISFNYMPVAKVLDQITALTGREWYLDYDKDIHYFPLATEAAPFNIDSNNADYYQLDITKDNTNIKNRVYVRGGKYISDPTTISMVADGEQVVFLIPDEPVGDYDWTLEVNSVEKSLGIKNTDKSDMWDYLVNLKQKYIENGENTATLSAGDVLTLTYKYYVPVLVAVSDKDSIEEIGVYEYAVFDNNITDLQQARDRASAELRDYAQTMVDGKFFTLTDGFVAGQYIHIELTEMDIDDDYLVQKVTGKSMGGGKFEYQVTIASVKKIGILNFLISMLEQDKNALDIDKNETVDELFEPTDEEFTINDQDDSIGLTDFTPPYEWGTFKWGLSQWGS